MSYIAIDIGSDATLRDSASPYGYTYLIYDNPANESGIITSVYCYVHETTVSSIKVGTFYGSGTSWTLRDYETLTPTSGGGLKTFNDLNISVSINDVIGFYCVE